MESRDLNGCGLAQSEVSAHRKEAFGTLNDLSTEQGGGWVTWHWTGSDLGGLICLDSLKSSSAVLQAGTSGRNAHFIGKCWIPP